ncbi:hypothetical protein CRI93_11610 [Longimonas halophila]|uniref:Ava_C0101 and related proteins n=1 Tax=Longimonas halophila TaxID=1469170 RepID=A0A2H3P384_9BACT|nr:DUF5996 family protein [Longimonas halophila]PEN05745.1 hypothetical protein CRI93_11610 [Longimonas halophila]
MSDTSKWPALPPLAEWEATCTTVHMWLQIIGKIRLEQSPWINHSWGSALYMTPRGLTTSSIPHDNGPFSIDIDWVAHVLRISTSRGDERTLALRPMTVAAFYDAMMQALTALDVPVQIMARPVEVEEAIPFAEDTTHAAYDANAMHRFWRALVQAERVLKAFRADFLGKASPVHLFWGAFDLAATRFSGREAPEHPGGVPNCADWVMEEAYSHELSSAGFWPGAGVGEAAFYTYMYPEPDGFRDADVTPEAAYYHSDLGEFVLPYEAVRTAANPDATLRGFLQSTYEAGATLGDWNRSRLERDQSMPPQ